MDLNEWTYNGQKDFSIEHEMLSAFSTYYDFNKDEFKKMVDKFKPTTRLCCPRLLHALKFMEKGKRKPLLTIIFATPDD